ncbi:hypothetical protein P170DRAFT_474321 [Aspergillus steynii IBT 23096]|uniref:Rhodopsin domain-containing protein n=1 Tax=Aspergillus steynii IBT 23096 TaxID=1392250 RepID=A0A2I2GCZ8_9EURO|nr:uncharacterized protein P170DRAFT_474321 [Aspergillus steynii IBT 23096]PLB50766.1 hypothetical protein P170DRAFT_474321 [Aspergillus steynii IBT 23096]
MASTALPPLPTELSSRAVSMVAVSTILETLALVTVTLRFVAKFRTRNIGIDDWLVLLAFVFATGLYITGMLICTIGYAGYHASELRPAIIERFLLLAYIDNIFYALTLPTIKIALLVMYRRIFPTRTFLYAAIAVGLVVLAWMVSVVIAQIFTCSPVQGSWDLAVAGGPQCIDQLKFYYGNSVSNVLTDVAILCLPMPMIWRLNLSRPKKWAVTGAFLAGGFVCISSIVRLSYLSDINNLDITYTLVAVGNWTSIETPLAVICACLPILPSLFRFKDPKTTSYNMSSRGGAGGSTLKSMRNDRSRDYETLDDGTLAESDREEKGVKVHDVV